MTYNNRQNKTIASQQASDFHLPTVVFRVVKGNTGPWRKTHTKEGSWVTEGAGQGSQEHQQLQYEPSYLIDALLVTLIKANIWSSQGSDQDGCDSQKTEKTWGTAMGPAKVSEAETFLFSSLSLSPPPSLLTEQACKFVFILVVYLEFK